MKYISSFLFIGALLLAWDLHAQAAGNPAPKPATGDLLCTATPGTLTASDTLVGGPDNLGFTNLFDYTKGFTGWWQDCQSGHSSNDRTNGAIWRVDTAQKAIYSTQRNGNTGGLLATKKKYGNYEIVFETWPSYGNDGGLFNRTSASGACYQTVLDYLGGASFGGVWGEGGYTSRDIRPANFNGNDSTLTIPGTTNNVGWTAWTATMNPASFGCSAGGCNQADWRKLWNLYGWNTVRIKFWGGLTSASKVHMNSFFRNKLDSTLWVPMWTDSLAHTDPASFVAFQVHGGGRFGGANGTWYRSVKIRPLTDLGDTIPVIVTSIGKKQMRISGGDIRVAGKVLTGSLDLDHQVLVIDADGRTLQAFNGSAGNFRYTLTFKARGMAFVQVKTSRGVETLSLGNVSE